MLARIVACLALSLSLGSLALAQVGATGAVYVATNSAQSNAVLAFDRSADGALFPVGSFATGGRGTGTGLGNQGGVVLSESNRWLFVVNAGSDDISVFEVQPEGLSLVDRQPSGGKQPVSIAQKQGLLYVLNAGGSAGTADSISGFRVRRSGKLEPIPGSTRPLSGASTGPAEILFSADGTALLVTEKATNSIDFFTLSEEGVAEGPSVRAANGATPFGFALAKRDQILISDAHGAPGITGSAVSVYRVSEHDIEPLASPVPTQHIAACWVVVTNDGRFAYTTNTGDGTITGFAISFAGELSPLNADGTTAVAGSGPIDAGLSNNSRFLFVLNSGSHSLSAFEVQSSGQLTELAGVGGLPPSTNGLAAR